MTQNFTRKGRSFRVGDEVNVYEYECKEWRMYQISQTAEIDSHQWSVNLTKKFPTISEALDRGDTKALELFCKTQGLKLSAVNINGQHMRFNTND